MPAEDHNGGIRFSEKQSSAAVEGEPGSTSERGETRGYRQCHRQALNTQPKLLESELFTQSKSC